MLAIHFYFMFLWLPGSECHRVTWEGIYEDQLIVGDLQIQVELERGWLDCSAQVGCVLVAVILVLWFPVWTCSVQVTSAVLTG